MLRHRNLATVARNTIHGFEIDSDVRLPQRAAALADRAGDPDVVPVRRRDGGVAPVRSRALCGAGAREPARPAPRWCRRNWCAASSTCRRAIQGSIGCRPSMSVARAFRQPWSSSARWRSLGPRIGVLYGLTEAPVTCYLPPHGSMPMRSVAVGSSIPSGRAARVRGAHRGMADERSAEPDDRARSLIRGDNVMAGYWQDEAATARRCATAGSHTGDVGELDDAGNLLDREPAQGRHPLRQQHHHSARKSRT